MIQWILLTAIFEVVSSLRLMSLDVPRLVITGQETILNCVFDLEEDTLYSIKWYRDDLEFFRYVPSDRPPNQFFPLQGLAMDLTRSSNGTVYITDVDEMTAGTYKCEISADAPSFQTVSAEKQMMVEGIESRYHLTLTSDSSGTKDLRSVFGFVLFSLIHIIS